jgi:hypothetical protein
VPDVKKVETAVRKNDTAAISPRCRRELGKFRDRLEFGRRQQESLTEKL